ncbi:MAG: phosphoribosylamine--glycine ligase [Candidatus Peribacteraceae bacterium]
MKILLISNSARGEAIAEALARSPSKPEIIAASTVKSPGLLRMCSEVHVIDIMNFELIGALAKAKKPDFAFIAPDDPIGAGLADYLEEMGIKSVAPKKALARIEASKGFTRELMKKHEVDASPLFRSFGKSATDDNIRSYIEGDLHSEYVVKYDALRGGKGVKVSGDHLQSIDEGVAYARECIDECGSVVIEEKLVGVEFSLLSFVSGETAIDMPAVQDHKRAYEGDLGPNTGGMGTYSDSNHSLPFLTDSHLKEASLINTQIAKALLLECGEPYVGILYGGFIVTKKGVKVIEYNARFGDPEALNVLSLLSSDFVKICQSLIDGTLSSDLVQFEKKATVCKYIVPKSYPDAKNEKGQRMVIPKDVPDSVRLFYGDVTQDDGENVLLGGSRSLGIVGIGKTIEEAERAAEEFAKKIGGPVRYRRDIGTKELIDSKVRATKTNEE